MVLFVSEAHLQGELGLAGNTKLASVDIQMATN